MTDTLSQQLRIVRLAHSAPDTLDRSLKGEGKWQPNEGRELNFEDYDYQEHVPDCTLPSYLREVTRMLRMRYCCFDKDGRVRWSNVAPRPRYNSGVWTGDCLIRTAPGFHTAACSSDWKWSLYDSQGVRDE